MKATGKKVEAVFVSSDKDDSAYKGYFGEMEGFLSLPYEDRERKAQLSALYKVSGIPTLVILNNKGEVITKNGREAVMSDPDGKKFPWIPPTFSQAIGSKFLQKSKDSWVEVGSDKLKGKTVGIYFSAHWCGPCRKFTPEFIKTYNTLVKDNKPFEVIFVSSDRDADAFKEYYGSMPWMAVPYEDKERRESLSAYYEVEGIPTLVIVDFDTGKIIQKDGRMAVDLDPQGKDFPWTPKPVNELTLMNASSLNDTAAMIVFLDDKDDEKKVLGAMEPLAKEVLSTNADEFQFMIGKEAVIVPRVKSLFSKAPSKTWLVGIIDIPKGGVYVADNMAKTTDITDAYIRAFYKSYKGDKLKASPIADDE